MAEERKKLSETDMSDIGVTMPDVDIPEESETPEVEGDVGEVARYTDEPPPVMAKLKDPPPIFYNHPQDLSDKEIVIVVEGLRNHVPLYAIARKIKCSRSWLGNKIKADPYLAETFADAREAYVDNLEVQAKRLIDQGNAAMIMFGLERLGKHRGWGQTDEDENREDDSRLVIGAIPEGMLADADAEIEANSNGVPIVEDGKIVSTVGVGDPMKMEMEQEKERSGIPPAVPPTIVPPSEQSAEQPVEADSVSPAPYEDSGYGYGGGEYVSGPWDNYTMDD